jgi:ketosteroid isomerase-like protein
MAMNRRAADLRFAFDRRWAVWLPIIACLLTGAFAASIAGSPAPQAAADERAIWDLERAYWRYVEANDLGSYRNLWHEAFLGWPSVSPAPVHKDHITDWITSQTSKGLAFKSGELKPAGIQVTGDVVVVFYWMTYGWVDKQGQGELRTIRITHTWLRSGKKWQIIGGMSMPESAGPRR